MHSFQANLPEPEPAPPPLPPELARTTPLLLPPSELLWLRTAKTTFIAITAAMISKNKIQHRQPQTLRLPDREACDVAGLVTAWVSTSGRATLPILGGAVGALVVVNCMSTASCRGASLVLTGF